MKATVSYILLFFCSFIHQIALPDEPIYKILAHKEVTEWKEARIEYYKRTKEDLPADFDTRFEDSYKKLSSLYEKYEKQMNILKENPAASMWGDINYAMSLDEMKQILKNTFNNWKQKGLIVSPKEFEKISQNYIRPTDDLTRIWGAEYLKKKINESPTLKNKYDVPQFIIVANDPNKIKVNIYFGNPDSPVANPIEDAEIYFEKITGVVPTGSDAMHRFSIGPSSGIGFTDFSASGNIIQDDKTGKYYVVDTERKSFDIPISADLKAILRYAQNRFAYLNNNIFSYTYNFNLK